MPHADEGKIKVLIADDHPVVLEGLALMLKQSPEILVVGFARSAEELRAKALKYRPEVVLLDVMMPDSDVMMRIHDLKMLPFQMRVLCCSSVTNRELIMEMVNAGISGFIPKTTSYPELHEAIIKVAGGENYFAQDIAGIIIGAMQGHNSQHIEQERDGFTGREMDIIKLICNSKTVSEIGEQLNMNIRTLESAKLRIMKKMGVKNVAGMVYYALKNSLINVGDLTVNNPNLHH